MGPPALPWEAQITPPPRPWGQGRGRTPCLQLLPKEGTPKFKGCLDDPGGDTTARASHTSPFAKCPVQCGETEAQSTPSRAGHRLHVGAFDVCPCVPKHVSPVLPWALGQHCHPLPGVQDGESPRPSARPVLNN